MAQFSIPLVGGVPLTLQTLAVSLTGVILGAKRGFVAILVYVLLGAAGLPVFANFSGGLTVVLGNTGGFILSFPIMAYIAGFVAERTDNKILVLLGMFASTVMNWICGMAMFSLITGFGIYQSFTFSVLPFIPTSIIKVVIAALLGLEIKRKLDRSGNR